MTMTQEDMDYRQGRSRQQYESSFFGVKVSLIAMVVIGLSVLIHNLMESL